MPEVLTPSHLAYAVTVDVESPDVSRNSRQSEVLTQARSPGIDGSTDLLTVPVGSPDVHRKFRLSKVPTHVGSSDVGCLVWTLTSREQCFLLTSEVPRSASELPT